MKHLQITTIDEIAEMFDELEIDEHIIFSDEDPDFLEKYGLEPCHYYIIAKSTLLFEKDYTVTIGRIDGTTTIAKDINILTNNNPFNYDERIYGIKSFITDYYEQYMEKNKYNSIYLIVEGR